jgi:hypothetical protein
MAKRVPLKILKQPKLVATQFIEHPFARKEIAKLTAKFRVYSLTKDCEAHYLWIDGAKKMKKRKKIIGSRT